jgi:predicted phage terminase large subunit-like protein
MQRLHEEDLSGYLLSSGGWEHINFPMRFEPTRPAQAQDAGHEADCRDPRVAPGELLWPGVFTEAKVKQLELDLGPFGAAGQLQQRPAPEGGGLFKREWFRIVDAAPTIARRVRGWDTAGTELDGDWTVGAKISEVGGQFYIEDVVREQRGPAGVDALIRQVATSDGTECSQREEREGGSAGKAVTGARAKMLVGYDYAEVSISGDKVTRAKPFRAQVEAGNVALVRGEWNEAYIRELCVFPTGKYDDQVDASSAAFNAVLLEPEPQDNSITWGR